jgi:3-hydroxybutyryl-CoA dehydrogenase
MEPTMTQPRLQRSGTGFKQAVVVGAGIMGSGIAQSLATAGLDVICVDVSAEALDRARQTILDGRFGLRRAFQRGRLTEPVQSVASRIEFAADLGHALGGADLVIEAVPEDIGLKVRLFRQLDTLAPADCLLVSNTSGFPIAALAAASDRPGQVLGWHWASPPPVMRLAEIVTHDLADTGAIERLTELAKACGKRPVLVRDQPRAWGFVANRVYFAMIAEARRVVQEGVVTEAELDQLMVDCFNWPVGPLAMVDSAHAGWEAPQGAGSR